ncbi:MAG: hypothetical protein JST84_12675 [Acidobacteria bacterium]|nr:hypothetical protein [Acidobacteriota bacterium]
MFETETEQMTEQRRSRLLMILGGVGALGLAIVIVFLSRGTRTTPVPAAGSAALPGGTQVRLENAVRAGSPEFDGYKAKVTLEDFDKIGASNAMGMTQLALKARLTNRGDRTLTGIEIALRAMSYSEEGKALALNYGHPVPNKQSQLKPGESMPITVKVDLPSTISEADVSDIVPEITGLRFQ